MGSAPPAPTPLATPAPPAGLDSTCVQNPDCSSNAWCADETYINWCQAHDASQCPTPGLNRGVSDSDCAQCETGYKWWPCNDAELCECTGTALAQFGAKMEPKKRSARTKHERKHSFLAPNVP